jgi:adenylate/nucleoside-diphosphate kinase
LIFFCLIQATDLIIENIKQQTELGKIAREILIKGQSVPDTLVATIIDEKMNSPEVMHHGMNNWYLICC